MKQLRIVLALILGIVVGSLVNMGIIMLSPMLVPPPPGADMTTAEGLATSMHLLQPKHFLMPLLAHALGTFSGALTSASIAPAKRKMVAYVIGAFFLIGGIAASVMIPAPAWFIAVDLVVAYLPMAWLALQVVNRTRGATGNGGTQVAG